MAERLTIKRGATFRIRRALPADLRGATFRAEVRAMGSGSLVGELSVRELDGGNTICLLELESATHDWPLTVLSADIWAEFPGGDSVVSSTIHIEVQRNVTLREA